MSRLDDRLTRELERIASPAAPVRVFERVARRRGRRHMLRRVQAAALVVVVLAGTIGGFVFLSDAFRDGSTEIGGSVTPIPSATITTPPGPIDMGLGFPVCDIRSMSADFDGNGTSDAASVATKMSDVGGCPAPGTSTEVLVVDLDGDGKADASGGPLACPIGCEPFAAPDVDADGLPEIAIVVDRADDGTSRIQLWDITTPPGGQHAVVPFVGRNSDPATFSWGTVVNWGGSGPERFGVSCTSRTSPPLVTEWQAIPTGPDTWHISEHGYHVVGTELRSTFEDSYDVPGEETVFPDGGGDEMCGAPVSSTAPPPTTADPGLGFPVCNVEVLKADLTDDGVIDTAWTATKAADVGPCPTFDGSFTVVAIDVTGDGVADGSAGPLEHCLFCHPFAAIDLDGDGIRELVVVEQSSSVTQYALFSIHPALAETGQALEPITVAAPGDPDAGFKAGEPLTFWAGGDEGYASYVECADSPSDLIITQTSHPVEGPGSDVRHFQYDELGLTDGRMHVIGRYDWIEPTSTPFEGWTGSACGVAFYP
jgi:hypothetical protein